MGPFTLDDMGSLALLAKVVEQQSFSAAARDLGLAKSAVSKRIAVLERKLGVRLLVRTTRSVTLSEAGMRVHAHCAGLLAAARGAAASLAMTDAGERGCVRINAPVLYAERTLTPLLQRFLDEHPGIEMELSADDALVDLASGRHDVVVRIAQRLPNRSLAARTIGHDRLVLIASPDYLARHGEPKAPEDLVQHRCMRYVQRSAAMEWRFKSANGEVVDPVVVSVPARFAAGDDASLRAAAVHGVGLTIMPLGFVAREVAAGELKFVLDGRLWQPERTVHALLPEGRLAAPRVRKVVDFLAAHANQPMRVRQ